MPINQNKYRYVLTKIYKFYYKGVILQIFAYTYAKGTNLYIPDKFRCS